MKEKIEYLRQKIAQRPRATVIISVLALSVIAIGSVVFSFLKKTESANAENVAATISYNLLDNSSVVGVVGADEIIIGGKTLSNSWPGEIISSEISQIQPQREGVITNWLVRIGDTVSAGEVLGKISAAPATPELIKMLAEQSEMASRTKAGADIADKFALKETGRLEALRNSLSGNTASGSELSFKALDVLRSKLEAEHTVFNSFLERTLSRHAVILGGKYDWRNFRLDSLNKKFGIINPDIQNKFEFSFVRLVEKLEKSADPPVEEAEAYFSLVTQLANNSVDNADADISEFKLTAAEDQKEFFDMLSDYRMAQAEVADKETEYKIMLSEGAAMVEKDRSMARAESDAAETAYNTVAKEINGGVNILSPRSGTVSAIYKKVGDLVDPAMPIAVVSGFNKGNFTVRTRIPNNIKKPAKGELLSVVRPGFQNDVYAAKIIGIGTSLDENGSYMADAVLLSQVDWPAGASVRVIPPENSNFPIIKLSSVFWDASGAPYIWGISDGGRIFARKITIGRTLGASVEVYAGIKNGERYLISPAPDLKENMLLEDILPKENVGSSSAKSGGKGSMGGMEME
ncbi:MAG: hypothetical protein Q7S36_00305 [Candidatus Liptonbacteria bacterium]|nr:hypothetical protein [Candidatus Liptonbacteria bacterium]